MRPMTVYPELRRVPPTTRYTTVYNLTLSPPSSVHEPFKTILASKRDCRLYTASYPTQSVSMRNALSVITSRFT
eukprot:6274965-Pyramimonas_sp.AAC.1